MRYAGYQDLAAELVDDVKALERLMGRLIETYPDGWAKDKIEVFDERGKEDTERVRGMAKTGVTYGGDGALLRHPRPGVDPGAALLRVARRAPLPLRG